MTDNLPVTKALNSAPVISAESYQHMGRYAGAAVLAVFEQIGGVKRFAEWADHNPSDYFTKVFPKIMSRSTQVDVTGNITIDEAISRLERQTPAVDAEFTEVKEWDL